MVGPSVNDMPALAAILQPVIDSLRIGQGINKIIVLSHLQQLSLEQALAPLLNGVDVIIAGGSHSLLADANDILRAGDVAVGTYPQLRTGANGQPTLLVNTAAEYRYVGRLVVAFDSLGVIDTSMLNPMINGAYATDSAGVARVWGNYANAFNPGTKGANVRALTNAMQTVIVAKDGNVFGKASVFLEGRREFTRTEETNLGNLTSDANLWQARRADPTVTLSLKNGGGIRQAMGTVNATGSTVTLGPTAPNPAANKQAGDISQLDIENSLRFNNRLSVVTVPVSGVKALLEHGVAQTAPGQTPGRFPQVGGMAFSYDPSLPVNSRIRSVVRLDSLGNIVDTLVRNGQIHGNPNRTYKMVTLNFLAGGGDGYPFAANSTNRVDLDTVITAPGAATFTVPGSEQDAFAEYMVVRHPANSPYAIAETAAAQDFRIQDLSRRNEGLLPFDVANLVAPANNSRLLTSPTNSTPVQIVWNRAINAQLYKWSLTTATGNFAPGLVNIVSNNNGTDTTLTLTVSRIDSLLASLGVAPGDSINTRWTVKSFYSNGSDSTLAAAFNLRLVRDAQISNFNLLLPTSNARIVVRGPASTPVNITWQTATSPAAAPIRYTWLADPAANFNSPLLQFASDNQGANTQLSLTTGIIDSLLNLAGVPIGDSITISWTVSARSGISSKLASSPQQLRFIRVGLTSSVPSIELSKVRMYPNPSEGEVTLEASDVILLIVVRDLLGAEVLRMQPNEATVKLQLQHLPAGMYLIQGETRQGSFNERLLRKR
jgi:2',3'-cyclic-nucleotide 2'-phosphodiesterase (5'-nucleotidase family)